MTHSVQLHRGVSKLLPLSQSRFLVVYESGDFDVHWCDPATGSFYWIETPKQFEHSLKIESINIEGNFCVTVGQDQAVKLWDLDPQVGKQLIRDIVMHGVESACFINSSLDLAVGHQGKITKIKAERAMPSFFAEKRRKEREQQRLHETKKKFHKMKTVDLQSVIAHKSEGEAISSSIREKLQEL